MIFLTSLFIVTAFWLIVYWFDKWRDRDVKKAAKVKELYEPLNDCI